MERRELDNIYLDEEGYKEYIEMTLELKRELDAVNSQISAIILEGRKDEISCEYDRLKNMKKNLTETIETREREEQKIVLVSRLGNGDFLDIGDVVKVNLVYPDGAELEDTFELVAGENDLSGEISKISINKPLGQSVYKKKIGEVGFFAIKEGKVSVTILEKVNVKKYSLKN